MLSPVLTLLLVLAGQAVATKPDPALASIGEQRLMKHLTELSSPAYEGRGAGTPGGAKAAKYIRERFAEVGLKPAGSEGFDQAFEFEGHHLANLVGKLAGDDESLSDEVVVVGAHYDHLGIMKDEIYPGADDNASGCAALIEVARAFALEKGHRRTLLFIAFDSEEHGLLGSRYFVDHPTVPREKIVAMINLDMVSRGDPKTVQVCGASLSPDMKAMAEGAAPAVGLTLRYDFEKKWRHASDHGPFGDANIPFLYFGVEDHPDYHKPTDTADKAVGSKLERIARLTYLTALAVTNADHAPVAKKP
jgi:Zn-dependent M28 family amino/carboxypeptidase